MATNITFKCYSINPGTGQTGERSATISIADQVVNLQEPPFFIQSISLANPGVLTLDRAHGWTNGDTVEIRGSASSPTNDGSRTVANVSGATLTAGVNVTAGQNVPGGFVRRTATTVTADKARTLVLDASTANTNGVAPGTYENTGGSVFRQQFA